MQRRDDGGAIRHEAIGGRLNRRVRRRVPDAFHEDIRGLLVAPGDVRR